MCIAHVNSDFPPDSVTILEYRLHLFSSGMSLSKGKFCTGIYVHALYAMYIIYSVWQMMSLW